MMDQTFYAMRRDTFFEKASLFQHINEALDHTVRQCEFRNQINMKLQFVPDVAPRHRGTFSGL